MVIATKRWRARGGSSESLELVVTVAVPLGIIGARLYHVATDSHLYFGPGRNPVDALKIWQGGLGVWGAIAFGVLGAWLVARRRQIRFPALLDAMAPGILVAQAIGRLGNWFNQELFGRPTTLPWALEIAPQYRPAGFEQFGTFHPTFLYEMLWNLAAAGVLVWLDRRFRLGHGKVFALYVMLYTAGRFWIEALRIDTVTEIAGFRLNNYTSLILFLAALAWLIWLVRNRPGREAVVEGARSHRRAESPTTTRPSRKPYNRRPDEALTTVPLRYQDLRQLRRHPAVRGGQAELQRLRRRRGLRDLRQPAAARPGRSGPGQLHQRQLRRGRRRWGRTVPAGHQPQPALGLAVEHLGRPAQAAEEAADPLLGGQQPVHRPGRLRSALLRARQPDHGEVGLLRPAQHRVGGDDQALHRRGQPGPGRVPALSDDDLLLPVPGPGQGRGRPGPPAGPGDDRRQAAARLRGSWPSRSTAM